MLNVPDIVRILRNGAVGGKDAGAGDVDERHLVPRLVVLIGLGDLLLSCLLYTSRCV